MRFSEHGIANSGTFHCSFLTKLGYGIDLSVDPFTKPCFVLALLFVSPFHQLRYYDNYNKNTYVIHVKKSYAMALR